jgi:hypothetical protein
VARLRLRWVMWLMNLSVFAHRFRVHFTMWEVDRTGDVAGDVRIAGARVDHDDRGKVGLEIDRQMP